MLEMHRAYYVCKAHLLGYIKNGFQCAHHAISPTCIS